MIARLVSLVALLLPGPALAADRTVTLGSFERVRVQGPFQVVIAAARAPAATVSGDPAAIEAVEVGVEGETLTVRPRLGRWEEQPRTAGGRVTVVTLGTDRLVAATVIGGGRIRAERMAGARVDLSVTGAGAIAVADLRADAANATVIGNGSISVAGRASQARLLTNGSGSIDASGLDAGDLVVRLDGPGATTARARFTAKVTNTGLGQVAVAGSTKCTIVSNAGGPVACGR